MAAVGHHHRQAQPPGTTPTTTTQLEFHQAMRDFKTMFPEMDDDVIEAVLRANQGAVDATIDQLLAMSTDNENERLRTEMDATDNAEAPPGYSPTTPPPTYQQAVPGAGGSSGAATASPEIRVATIAATASLVPLAITEARPVSTVEANPTAAQKLSAATVTADTELRDAAGATSGMPLRVMRNWAPTHLGPLPCDFLRISMPMCGRSSKQSRSALTAVLCSEVIQQKMEENERQRKIGASTEDPELVQYLEDERIALFLQNEEFMQELRSNKDFLTTLERDARARNSNLNWASTYDSDEDESSSDNDKPPESSVGAFPYTKSTTTVPTEESDAAFREKLKNMGKLSRSKFAQLARLFSRQKKRSFKQILSESSMPSKDNLLLSEYDGGGSDSDEDSGRPKNEYHPIKNSPSSIHESSPENVPTKLDKQ